MKTRDELEALYDENDMGPGAIADLVSSHVEALDEIDLLKGELAVLYGSDDPNRLGLARQHYKHMLRACNRDLKASRAAGQQATADALEMTQARDKAQAEARQFRKQLEDLMFAWYPISEAIANAEIEDGSGKTALDKVKKIIADRTFLRDSLKTRAHEADVLLDFIGRAIEALTYKDPEPHDGSPVCICRVCVAHRFLTSARDGYQETARMKVALAGQAPVEVDP